MAQLAGVSSWDWRGNALHTPGTIHKWSFVSLDRAHPASEIGPAVGRKFASVFRSVGLIMSEMPTYMANSLAGTLPSFARARMWWSDVCCADLKGGGDITFVLVDNRAHYLEVKEFFDERKTCSQVLLRANLLKGERKTPHDPIQTSYACNVALKVNSKLHGVNLRLWPDSPSAALLAPPGKAPVMVSDADVVVFVCFAHRSFARARVQVLGFDVHHPPVGALSGSTAALVGSLDDTYGGGARAYADARRLTGAQVRPLGRRVALRRVAQGAVCAA